MRRDGIPEEGPWVRSLEDASAWRLHSKSSANVLFFYWLCLSLFTQGVFLEHLLGARLPRAQVGWGGDYNPCFRAFLWLRGDRVDADQPVVFICKLVALVPAAPPPASNACQNPPKRLESGLKTTEGCCFLEESNLLHPSHCWEWA